VVLKVKKARSSSSSALDHPLIMSSADASDVVFHLSLQTARFYERITSRGQGATAPAPGSSAPDTLSPAVLKMAVFLTSESFPGCQRITELNYDVNRLFTPGLRPEIRQDFRILFACLNENFLSTLYRARQQFISMEEADSLRYSLFVFISELWRPGCMNVSLLYQSSLLHSDFLFGGAHAEAGGGDSHASSSSSSCSGGAPGRGSGGSVAPRGVLSSLLRSAHDAVLELRSDYRVLMAARSSRPSLRPSLPPSLPSLSSSSLSSSTGSGGGGSGGDTDPLEQSSEAATSLLHLNAAGRDEPPPPPSDPSPDRDRAQGGGGRLPTSATVESVKAALQRQKALASASWPRTARSGGEEGGEGGAAQSEAMDALYLPSNDDLVVALQQKTLAYYTSLSPQAQFSSTFSPLTARVLQYVASQEHSLAGFKQIFELRNDVSVLFTPGPRPEIKKDFRVLFGWHSTELLNPAYRCRQQFTFESHAALYRRAIFVYITELWKPQSVDEEVLRGAYIHVKRDTLCTKTTGVLSMSLLKLQEVVLELRGPLGISAPPGPRRGDKRGLGADSTTAPAVEARGGALKLPAAKKVKKSIATSLAAAAATRVMPSSSVPAPSCAAACSRLHVQADEGFAVQAKQHEARDSGATPYLAARHIEASCGDGSSVQYKRKNIEETLTHYENFEMSNDLIEETLSALQHVRAHLEKEKTAAAQGQGQGQEAADRGGGCCCCCNLKGLLAEVRQSRGECLFSAAHRPEECQCLVLFGWFQQSRAQAQPLGAALEQLFRSSAEVSATFKFSLCMYVLELWEPGSVPLPALQKAYHGSLESSSGEKKALCDLLGELQMIVMDLRLDFCSSSLR
jgi:hypothetical protein